MENKKTDKNLNAGKKEINTLFFTQLVIVIVAITALLLIRFISRKSYIDISNEYQKYFGEDIPLSAISSEVEGYFKDDDSKDDESATNQTEKETDEEETTKPEEDDDEDDEKNTDKEIDIDDNTDKKDSIKAVSVSKLNKMQIPVMGRISSPFGYRTNPFTGIYCLHDGMDIAAPMGTDILAAMDGVVIASVEDAQIGNYIKIDHGNGIVTAYGHCSKLIAEEGDKVKKGDLIAKVGSTGHSTGPHTHFEVRVNGVKVNPAYYLDLSGFSET
jgi:murein DD-endopeptidase MepM/ murein hydrolase activator NlpD